MARLTMEEARTLVSGALQAAGANAAMAQATARALVLAEAQGLASHGLSRVSQYATHLRNGRVNGAAMPANDTIDALFALERKWSSRSVVPTRNM